jgi:hypothetical protein
MFMQLLQQELILTKQKSYLISKCYNLTQLNPDISFKLAFELEINWDVIYVEYSPISVNLAKFWVHKVQIAPTATERHYNR